MKNEKIFPMPRYAHKAFGIYLARLESLGRSFPQVAQQLGDFVAAAREAQQDQQGAPSREIIERYTNGYEELAAAAEKDPALGIKLKEAEFALGSALVLGYTRKALKRAGHDFNKAAEKMPRHAGLLKEAGAAFRGLVPVVYQPENAAVLAAYAHLEAATDKIQDAATHDEKLGGLLDKVQGRLTDALLRMEERHPGAFTVQDEMKTLAQAPKP